MKNAKRKFLSVLLLIVLLATVLSTMSACGLTKMKRGVSVHKDGMYYTVYIMQHYAVLHRFDANDSQQYEIPSQVRYKLITYPVTQVSAQENISPFIVEGGEAISKLTVSETVEVLDLDSYYYRQFENLTSITVDADNSYYTSDAGVLYTKDKRELIYFPAAKSTLYLPTQVELISDNLAQKKNLSNISVSEYNTNFSSNNGVLFTADGSKMLCYPRNKTDETYTIPTDWSVLDVSGFKANQHLKYIEVEEGNTIVSAYKGDLYSVDGSILLYRPNSEANVLELPDGITTIGRDTLYGVKYLYVPIGLQKVVFESYNRYDEVNANNPIGRISYVYFESDELPFCLRYTSFTGNVKFGVTREQFQQITEAQLNGGQL